MKRAAETRALEAADLDLEIAGADAVAGEAATALVGTAPRDGIIVCDVEPDAVRGLRDRLLSAGRGDGAGFPRVFAVGVPPLQTPAPSPEDEAKAIARVVERNAHGMAIINGVTITSKVKVKVAYYSHARIDLDVAFRPPTHFNSRCITFGWEPSEEESAERFRLHAAREARKFKRRHHKARQARRRLRGWG